MLNETTADILSNSTIQHFFSKSSKGLIRHRKQPIMQIVLEVMANFGCFKVKVGVTYNAVPVTNLTRTVSQVSEDTGQNFRSLETL